MGFHFRRPKSPAPCHINALWSSNKIACSLQSHKTHSVLPGTFHLLYKGNVLQRARHFNHPFTHLLLLNITFFSTLLCHSERCSRRPVTRYMCRCGEVSRKKVFQRHRKIAVRLCCGNMKQLRKQASTVRHSSRGDSFICQEVWHVLRHVGSEMGLVRADKRKWSWSWYSVIFIPRLLGGISLIYVFPFR